ncbi:SH3 domain-containing protein [Roseovarius dicentrarchi]|uniref:SH3 domain-containing protein n=1 Tax=Roseovarius dicentrarchi TaxID=2250573 RepID=UPI001396727A|nr:SH3 domain-containing protein [Roseovarius dicentrarchi]
MWRLILISFGFLAAAFYQASGGADYAPAPGSLQVALRDKPFFAPPLKVAATADQSADAIAEADAPKLPPIQKPKSEKTAAAPMPKTQRAQPTFAGLSGIGKGDTGGFEITLASAARTLDGGDAIPQRPLETMGAFNADTLVEDVNRTPIDQALAVPQQPADIRSVIGSRVNIRSGPGTDYAALDQLTQGTQVEVLDRRGDWLELRNMQTGQTGWMADWLITAVN